MASKISKQRVFYGGWYQRTTLHLSEVYDFLANCRSDLKLNTERLKKYHEEMGIETVTREAGYLEYVQMETVEGIRLRYFEDGLYVLDMEGDDVVEINARLKKYCDDKLSPALGFIFSLGAPTPKILANINSEHPTAVAIVTSNPEKYEVAEAVFGDVYSSLSTPELILKKTRGYIFLITEKKYENFVENLVDMQIFFREYKDQLHRYLNIHRVVWEEIEAIKERGYISGVEVDKTRMKLEGYQKTINLIGSRINQMAAYVHTRAGVSRELSMAEHLDRLFRYKFEVLTDTHSYTKEIWAMTTSYLNSAVQIIGEIRQQATNKSIQSLQLITTYGVIGGLVGYLSRDSWPKVTESGVKYLALLLVSTLLVNRLVSFIYQRNRYKLSFVERAKKF